MGEGLQTRPWNACTTARKAGSGLEALTHWWAAYSSDFARGQADHVHG